jgi:ribosomal-protein-serine acetyltransferase
VNPIHWELGDGLVIRTLTPDDDVALFELVERNRDRLRPWMPWEPTTESPADTRVFIERALAAEPDRDANGIWVDGQLTGAVGMRVDMMDQKAEVGYWIDRDAEGRGIVTRACERFLAFAFEDLGLHRVELLAATGNERSRAVAERLGMVLEGTGRENGRIAGGFVDLVTYGILDREWRARQA